MLWSEYSLKSFTPVTSMSPFGNYLFVFCFAENILVLEEMDMDNCGHC